MDGPFDLRIATGRSPAASLSGDADAIDLVDLRVEGGTLMLRRRGRAGRTPAMPIAVRLATSTLRGATIVGGATVRIDGMTAERADLSVAGSGTLTVASLVVEQGQASAIGGGRIALAGRARSARLLANAAGSIDAAGLVADELLVRLDGPGEVAAQAPVSTTGAGRVTVTGNSKCTVRAPAGSAVRCGKP